jgi:hypothetical protein
LLGVAFIMHAIINNIAVLEKEYTIEVILSS